MPKKYKNMEDGQVYSIVNQPIKTKTSFGWKDDGTLKVLKNDNGNIYLLSTLIKAPQLWEVYNA